MSTILMMRRHVPQNRVSVPKARIHRIIVSRTEVHVPSLKSCDETTFFATPTRVGGTDPLYRRVGEVAAPERRSF